MVIIALETDSPTIPHRFFFLVFISFHYVALETQLKTGDTRLPFRRAGAIFSPLVFLSPKDLAQPLLFPSLSSSHVIAFVTITVAHHSQHPSFFLRNSFTRYYLVAHFACLFLLSGMES